MPATTPADLAVGRLTLPDGTVKGTFQLPVTGAATARGTVYELKIPAPAGSSTLEVALAAEGIEVELIDPRTLIPLDLETMDLLRFRLNAEIECALASKTRLRDFVEKYVRSDVSIDEVVHQLDHNGVDGGPLTIKDEMDAQTQFGMA